MPEILAKRFEKPYKILSPSTVMIFDFGSKVAKYMAFRPALVPSSTTMSFFDILIIKAIKILFKAVELLCFTISDNFV